MHVPHSVVVSGDGYLDQFDVRAGVYDAEKKIWRVPVQIHTPIPNKTALAQHLRAGDASPRIKETLSFTNRSICARLGFEIENPQFGDSIYIDDLHMMEATGVFYPGEDIDGKAEESSLPRFIENWMTNNRIHVGRLFAIPEGLKPFDAARVNEEMRANRLRLHHDSVVMEDGTILVPSLDYQYYIMHHLMPEDALHSALIGSGRGGSDVLQPVVRGEMRDIPPDTMRVSATQFSLLRHMGILNKQVYDLLSRKVEPRLKHGNSRVWDGGKTSGKYPRQLEFINTSDTAVSQKGIAASLNMYPTEGTRMLRRMVGSAPSKVVEEGVTLDHFLEAKKNQDMLRQLHTHSQRPGSWGMLMGPGGVRTLRNYKHDVHQERALITGIDTFLQDGVPADSHQGSEGLQACLKMLSDPRQRCMLFCKEMPSAATVSQMMARGVRTIVTDNLSKTASKLYMSATQVAQYKELSAQGLQLYVLTEEMIRKQYYNMLVRLEALDRMKKCDTRLVGYAASMDGVDKIMDQGHFPEFLEQFLSEHPNAALATGASKSGGMLYMNRIAQALKMLTIGIANEIPGQEAGDTTLDAIMFFVEDGIITRQELMNYIGTLALQNIGAEGSDFEGALERMMLKLGRCSMSPLFMADPAGLGPNGAHYWQPNMNLQQQHAAELPEELFGLDPSGKKRRLSRSPYVKDMCHLITDYREVARIYSEFEKDPMAYWQNEKEGRFVPKNILLAAQARVLRNAEYTGLPMPAHWKKLIEEGAIEKLAS